MCLFSKKYIGDHADAEDIVQEMFIELWNQRSKFESLEQVKAFLYLSIKNRCINYRKHLLVKGKYFNSARTDNEPVFEEHVLEAEVIQNINNALNSLPEQRRQIIILNMQGLTNGEIAEDMLISINTVKLQKKIAYKQLREKLKYPLLALLLIL
jgi:RNA polymerase sigma-70 factor (family 1)